MTSRIPSADLPVRVVSMQRFSLHDGPGIRTTVFLQGCPLHCPWCANPESQPAHPVQRHSRGKCSRCLRCVPACPHGCIRPGTDGYPVFDRAACRGCGSCEEACPSGALSVSGKTRTVGDILETVLKDRDYYRNSGGGVTFSGGDPFFQPEGLQALLEGAKALGLSTAVETCGQVPTERILRAEPFTDLFLYDVKHGDPAELKKVTGGDAGLIFHNLETLARTGKVLVRIPCIPGFNLDEAVLDPIFDRILRIGIRQVHLLPYHVLGKDKYGELSLPYACPPEGLQDSDLEPFARDGRARGLDVRIGG